MIEFKKKQKQSNYQTEGEKEREGERGRFAGVAGERCQSLYQYNWWCFDAILPFDGCRKGNSLAKTKNIKYQKRIDGDLNTLSICNNYLNPFESC